MGVLYKTKQLVEDLRIQVWLQYLKTKIGVRQSNKCSRYVVLVLDLYTQSRYWIGSDFFFEVLFSQFSHDILKF